MTAGREAEYAAVLAEHRFNKGLAICNCGAELGGRGDRMREWRTHVAAVLAALPDTQATREAAALRAEWGVRHSQGVRKESSEQAAREWLVGSMARYEANFRNKVRPEVVRRFVSDWHPADRIDNPGGTP